ncbi:flagellar hook-length control protein FliK [Roseateles violae]|uniref:Flagellar hook-length control protein FliK n=1 Tax=Roseateles violae TaxID=3058042 RepID=A0ABT8DTD5_9BURK|nr:flagellar hook-length control protein FliK [Pelomonas sp. PFR6]MDN3921566.1 flagellar hook-length control protein FliK [Pelomonas sp. PFR6]
MRPLINTLPAELPASSTLQPALPLAPPLDASLAAAGAEARPPQGAALLAQLIGAPATPEAGLLAAAEAPSFASALQQTTALQELPGVAEPEAPRDEAAMALDVMGLLGLLPMPAQQPVQLPTQLSSQLPTQPAAQPLTPTLPQTPVELAQPVAAATLAQPSIASNPVLARQPGRGEAARSAAPSFAAATASVAEVQSGAPLAAGAGAAALASVATANPRQPRDEGRQSSQSGVLGQVFALDGAAAPAAAAPIDATAAAAELPPAPTLRLPNGESRQWQSPLLQALGDRIQLQIAARSEQAHIRLDPPQMGRVDIALRHEAGNLQISLSASHGEVLRQLHSVSEQMRWDLAQRHSGEVSVQVAAAPAGAQASSGREADARQGGQRQAPDRESQEPGRALQAEADDAGAPFALA